MFEALGPLRDSIRDVILTSDVDMGMIRLTEITETWKTRTHHREHTQETSPTNTHTQTNNRTNPTDQQARAQR